MHCVILLLRSGNNNNITDHRILWELIKFEIRLFTQAFSKDKAVKKSDNLRKLEDKNLRLI